MKYATRCRETGDVIDLWWLSNDNVDKYLAKKKQLKLNF